MVVDAELRPWETALVRGILSMTPFRFRGRHARVRCGICVPCSCKAKEVADRAVAQIENRRQGASYCKVMPSSSAVLLCIAMCCRRCESFRHGGQPWRCAPRPASDHASQRGVCKAAYGSDVHPLGGRMGTCWNCVALCFGFPPISNSHPEEDHTLKFERRQLQACE